MKKYFFFVLVLFSLLDIIAQESSENKLGSWYIINGNHKVSDKLSVFTGVQLWTYEPVDNFNLLLLYTSLNYSLSNNLITSIGYGNVNWDDTFEISYNKNIKEHRVYEQINLKGDLKKISFQNRLRLEHRFIDTRISNNIKHRMRYRFKVKYPLNKTLFLTAYDELIFNITGAFFQQNRLYGAIGIKTSKNSNLQLGYLKNDFTTKSLYRLQVGLYINTNFKS